MNSPRNNKEGQRRERILIVTGFGGLSRGFGEKQGKGKEHSARWSVEHGG